MDDLALQEPLSADYFVFSDRLDAILLAERKMAEEPKAAPNPRAVMGDNSGIADPNDRRAFLIEQITKFSTERKRDDAMSQADFQSLDSMGKVSALKQSLIDNVAYLYRNDPDLDVDAGILCVVTVLSDNSEGGATIGVSRLADILGRSVKTIRRGLLRLKNISAILIDPVPGAPSLIRPFINPSFGNNRDPLSWLLDAYSPVERKPSGRPRKTDGSEIPWSTGDRGISKYPGQQVSGVLPKTKNTLVTTTDKTQQNQSVISLYTTNKKEEEKREPDFSVETTIQEGSASIAEQTFRTFHLLFASGGTDPKSIRSVDRSATDEMLRQLLSSGANRYGPQIATDALLQAVATTQAAHLTSAGLTGARCFNYLKKVFEGTLQQMAVSVEATSIQIETQRSVGAIKVDAERAIARKREEAFEKKVASSNSPTSSSAAAAASSSSSRFYPPEKRLCKFGFGTWFTGADANDILKEFDFVTQDHIRKAANAHSDLTGREGKDPSIKTICREIRDSAFKFAAVEAFGPSEAQCGPDAVVAQHYDKLLVGQWGMISQRFFDQMVAKYPEAVEQIVDNSCAPFGAVLLGAIVEAGDQRWTLYGRGLQAEIERRAEELFKSQAAKVRSHNEQRRKEAEQKAAREEALRIAAERVAAENERRTKANSEAECEARADLEQRWPGLRFIRAGNDIDLRRVQAWFGHVQKCSRLDLIQEIVEAGGKMAVPSVMPADNETELPVAVPFKDLLRPEDVVAQVDGTPIAVGSSVSHSRYGIGNVMHVEGNKVTANFGGEIKKIVASFLELVPPREPELS